MDKVFIPRYLLWWTIIHAWMGKVHTKNIQSILELAIVRVVKVNIVYNSIESVLKISF